MPDSGGEMDELEAAHEATNARALDTQMDGAATFSLVSLMHGRCLDAPSSAGTVYMWDCQPGNANQRWTYDPTTGEVKIHGNKCLDAWGAKRLDPIVVRNCQGGTNQKWDVALPGRVMLRGIKDEYGRSMCIDIAHQNRDLKAQLLLQWCHRGDNQEWRRSDSGIGGATMNIESDIGRCIDSPSSTPGTALYVWDCSSTNVNQRATRTVSSEIRIHNKCLDGQTLQPGMPLILWDCHGGANQKWNRDLKGRLASASNPAVCVDVWEASSYNGAPLKLHGCHDETNQKWRYIHIAYP